MMQIICITKVNKKQKPTTGNFEGFNLKISVFKTIFPALNNASIAKLTLHKIIP